MESNTTILYATLFVFICYYLSYSNQATHFGKNHTLLLLFPKQKMKIVWFGV